MAFRARYSILLHAGAAALAAISVLLSPTLYGADEPITVALVFDGSNQSDREPLQAYLTQAMGRPVKVVAPDSYSQTVAGLADGTYDFACLGALTYVRSHAKYGVVPLVQRASDLEFHSVFITRTDSSIRSLRDLKGRQFAFGDINSASAHLIPYSELMQAGINPETDLQPRYSGSHVATAAMVESGVVEAGVLDESVFKFLIQGGKLDGKKVRVFYTSKPFVDYVYVARKDVPKAEQQQFAHALLALKEGADDPVLIVLRAKKFIRASDQEYDNVRQIAHELKMF
ncbi:MAG: phosphate/phosphite/phosphonate ABC transporter substrate-binding protein [Candidatus Sulfotelmatobacter sp.]